jgi:DNA polymerase III subunit delta'
VSVWDELVGQERVVATLRDAARDAARIVEGEPGAAMTHAWLFTGPPGSGRSTAARAFAAALQCTEPQRTLGAEPGCGHCDGCHTALTGTHADVETVNPEGLSILTADTRELVARSARAPSQGRWQVVLLEDADRLQERAANVLLKAVEEPPPRGVWLLCVPAPEDLVPTIRSRCRLVPLRMPATAAIAEVLRQRDSVDPAMAAFAARAAQGHVGRARRLARDDEARRRRREVLRVPQGVAHVGRCYEVARELLAATEQEATQQVSGVNDSETSALKEALGGGGTRGGKAASSAAPRGSAGALKELERRQKSRGTRSRRDALDRALVDLVGFYRDVLVVQSGARVDLGCGDVADAVATVARTSTPESTLRRIEAVLACREAIGLSVAPLLALEEMTLALRDG